MTNCSIDFTAFSQKWMHGARCTVTDGAQLPNPLLVAFLGALLGALFGPTFLRELKKKIVWP